MTSRDVMLIELAADITRLVDGWRHVEHVHHDDCRRLIHRHPHHGLLDQLAAAAAGTRSDQEGTRQIPESRPPIAEEPFDVLLSAQACAAYLLNVTLQQPLHDDTATNLRAIPGHAANADDDTLTRCWVDIAHLRDRAETCLGWRPRAFRPRIRCPQCGRLASIVIKIEGGTLTDARCTACHTAWPREHWGILAGSV